MLGAVLTLAGCSDSSISSRDSYTPTYLFYTSDSTGTFSPSTLALYAVDPEDPSNPILVDAALSPIRTPVYSIAGTVESAGGTIADLHYDKYIYARGNNIFKVSAIRSNALIKRQISSESNASRMCGPLGDPSDPTGTVYDDYTNPDNSVLFYFIEDVADASPCPSSSADGDETLYMVRLGMSSSTPPLGGLFNYIPVAPSYSSSGALIGFIVLNRSTGALESRDLDLLNPMILATGVSDAVTMTVAPNAKAVLGLFISSVRYLHVFDPASGAMGTALHTENDGLDLISVPTDDNYFYFFDGDVLYRLPLGGNGASSIVVDESGGIGSIVSGYLSLSRSSLVYIYDDGANFLLRSIPTSGGTAKTLTSLPNTAGLRSFRSAAGRVYLTFINAANIRFAVSVPDSGGDPDVVENAAWTGFTYNPRQKLFADVDIIGRSGAGFAMSRMKPNVIYQTQYSTTGGVSLSSFDADTSTKLVDYGVPVSDFGDPTFQGNVFPPVPDALATQFYTLLFFGGENSNDVLLLHARNGGSVVRVTNDSVDDKYVGVSGGCTLGKGQFDPVFPLLLLLSVLYLWRRRKSRVPMR